MCGRVLRTRACAEAMPGSGMPATAPAEGSGAVAALAGAGAFYFLADAARRLARRGHGATCTCAPQRGRLAAPALTAGRHTVMALAMAVMLAPLM